MQRAAPEPAPARTDQLLRACPPRSLPPDRGVEGRAQARVRAGSRRGGGRADPAGRAGASRHAPRARAGLAKEQRRLWTRLDELQAADDWRGIVALETEALALARDLRGANRGLVGAIHGMLGFGFQGVGQ